MERIPHILLHHSETADPQLIEWIKHEIDSLLGMGGIGPVAVVLVLGLAMVVLPLGLIGMAIRRNRRAAQAARQAE